MTRVKPGDLAVFCVAGVKNSITILKSSWLKKRGDNFFFFLIVVLGIFLYSSIYVLSLAMKLGFWAAFCWCVFRL